MRFVAGKLEQRVRKKVVTTTFAYDNNGNVTQKTVDGTTTTYVYDYANRLTALGVGGATTTYAYDWAGNRVSQTGTTTIYLYPFKWYSIASSTGTGAKYATTTDYVFNGDKPVATVDQQTANGNATGTAKTRYIHPDHLGSTNVVTDENGNVVQTLDFYPYGSTRISVATSTNEKRKFIGQFSDDSSLSYLNARYYDNYRGQFISEDPVFLGTPKQQHLQDPQSLDSYSYSEDNPITNSDPSGNCIGPLIELLPACVGAAAGFAKTVAENPNASPQQLAIGTGSGFVEGLFAEEEALSALAVGGIEGASSLLQDKVGGQNPDWLKALGNATGAVGGRTAVMSTFAIGDTILTRLGVQAASNGSSDLVQTLLNQGIESGYSFYTTNTFLPSIVALGGVTSISYANGPSLQISSNAKSTAQSSGGSSTGFTAGGQVFSPGLLPRSANPVGQSSSGASVFCWGICH
jgi:RHS repeat-associated protein